MKYLIINVSEINLIDFETIQQTSVEKLRKSIDGQKTVVKWLGDETPEWTNLLTTKEGPYNQNEILTIMSTPYWWFVDGGEE